MTKCQYFQTWELPPLAGDKDVTSIRAALLASRVNVTNGAARFVTQVWGMQLSQFIIAVSTHVNQQHRIYLKPIVNPKADTKYFSANVNLIPGGIDEDEDVYVEIRLIQNYKVFIVDAHNHLSCTKRLPK